MSQSLHWKIGTWFWSPDEGTTERSRVTERQKCMRSTKRQSQSEQNKSVITDHVNTENDVVNGDEATVNGREFDRTTRLIREAVNLTGSLPSEPRL